MRPLRPLLAWLALVAPLLAWAQDGVRLAGIAGGRALLVINGEAPRFLGVGQSASGVRLIEVRADSAVVETGGERLTLRLGESPLASGAETARASGNRVVLEAGHGGHFVSSGQINGKHVEFIVDTGASVVALGRPDAERIGLKLDPARRVQMGSANGMVLGHQVVLSSVKLGDATLYEVPAVVMPTAMPYVLLGNSFLSRFQLRRDNSTLILEKRY